MKNNNLYIRIKLTVDEANDIVEMIQVAMRESEYANRIRLEFFPDQMPIMCRYEYLERLLYKLSIAIKNSISLSSRNPRLRS